MDTDLNVDGWYSVGPFSRVWFWYTVYGGLQTYTLRNPLYREETKGVLVRTITCIIDHTSHLSYVTTEGLPRKGLEPRAQENFDAWLDRKGATL
jgi:hypothetical protein